jgi:hypothetical protein
MQPRVTFSLLNELGTNMKPIEKVFNSMKISTLEKQTGLSRTALYKWVDNGCCPANRCQAVAKISGGLVTKQQLLNSIPQIEFEQAS